MKGLLLMNQKERDKKLAQLSKYGRLPTKEELEFIAAHHFFILTNYTDDFFMADRNSHKRLVY